ncbi:sulfotransferase family protein [Novosphingobium mangrovi (ex Hu et al. 2023)]|uniref:Sulfotransferase n=1 Tax=Novosphingobium mangrovi (ex Hu et al. 2023) TaxID=2930094 RepID=A0ABT0ABZ3_9SPHN|nr:sulfotransferase [Novosphingobium mangrovi (ex Hu et al. 2023)]MCJ1960720.1 sulfotransferase [Novosphingobium mangrovi (ex Hu et al. 2023)]
MQFNDIDFVIIGAAKSATTWLQKQLQSDPGVYMPDPELHYFSREYARGPDWYLSQFGTDPAGRTVGEKSNSYLYSPEAATRLHRHLPHVKLVAQLRNPVERAYSGYCMLFRRGEVGSDITSYLDPAASENMQLLGSGNFAAHLKPYIDLFGEERLLVLFFEGVMGDPDAQMALVRSHLGLPSRALASDGGGKVKDKTVPLVPPILRKRLAWMKPLARPLRGTPAFESMRGLIARKVQYPPLTEDLRKRLNDYYSPSIEALERISGQSLRHWYGPTP